MNETPVEAPKEKAVVEYLALMDNRFSTIASWVIRESHKRFMKLFMRVTDRNQRDQEREVVVWLAHTTLVYLTALEQENGSWNPTEGYLEAFDHLLKIKQAEALKLKQLVDDTSKAAPEQPAEEISA